MLNLFILVIWGFGICFADFTLFPDFGFGLQCLVLYRPEFGMDLLDLVFLCLGDFPGISGLGVLVLVCLLDYGTC